MEESSVAPTTPHLNAFGLQIRATPEKGRGVYATRSIARGTVVEVSPVLLFSPDEWEEHGKHTVLDHYTFVWRIPGEKPSMALALGLGSIFNHSSRPNVSYTRLRDTLSIEYTTMSDIQPGEELCISYGDESRLWFKSAQDIPVADKEDPWGGLDGITPGDASSLRDEEDDGSEVAEEPRDPDRIVDPADLPFERVRSDEELEGESSEKIKTFDAWVVDVQEPQQISTMLRFIRDAGLDTPDLEHLRRVRKTTQTSILLSVAAPPALPLPLGAPYQCPVPSLPAKDKDDMLVKNAIWPMNGIVRGIEERVWTVGEVEWVRKSLQRAVEEASAAHSAGELPIASYVCESPGEPPISASSHDTRTSARHPLRHSVIGAIRAISQIRIAQLGSSAYSGRNGDFYLLTSLSLFTTHEPCIMCSMALVHSRVKDVFFIQGMPGTGGCGGGEGRGCGVVGKGVNHRFGVWRWKGDWKGLCNVEEGTDA